jgi:hypothetical protein
MWALKQNAVIFCFDFGVPFVSKPMLQQSVQLQLFWGYSTALQRLMRREQMFAHSQFF